MTPDQKRAQHDGRRCRDIHPGVAHLRWAAHNPQVIAAVRGRDTEPDPDAGAVVLPPMTVAQVVAMINVLDRHKVEYLLIGGMAAQLQGVPIEVTRDADFNVNATDANLGRLVAALRELGAKIRGIGQSAIDVPIDEHLLRRMVSVQLVTTHGPMDVNFRPDGTAGYDDLIRSVVTLHLESREVRVATVGDIVRSKQAAGRPKDLVALPTYLRWLRANMAR